eukprot:scaffold53258_cov53-Attheya_sp.AAC.2
MANTGPQALVDHLKHGISRITDGVNIVPMAGDERGVQFKEADHEPGKELAWIDRSQFVTPECGEKTAVGRALARLLENTSEAKRVYHTVEEDLYLAIFISLMKGKLISDEKFDIYMETLPTLSALQHLPIFWPESSLEELQSSALKDGISTRLMDWEDEYDMIKDALVESGEGQIDFVDLETWIWARTIVSSRGFDGDGAKCLVPFVDMLNHCGPKAGKCSWIIDQGGFTLSLPSAEFDDDPNNEIPDIRPGGKVEISYGSHSNAHFLMNYGFSNFNDLEQDQNDKACIPVFLPSGQDDLSVQEIWEADGIGNCFEESRDVTLNIGHRDATETLLSLCRVASCDDLELKRISDLFRTEGRLTSQTESGLIPELGATLCPHPFSALNEIRAMQVLQFSVLRQLQKYSSSLDDDEALLKQNVEDFLSNTLGKIPRKAQYYNIRNAIIARRGEKRYWKAVWHHGYDVFITPVRGHSPVPRGF